MRKALGMGCLLLVLAVLLNHEARQRREAPVTEPGRELNLLCFSRGTLLPPAKNALTERFSLDDGLIAADRVLWINPRVQGLRMAAFDSLFRLLSHENYTDAESFLRAVEGLPDNTICAFQSRGDITWAPLEALGAEAKIARRSSWCMVAVRRPQGWIKLAEAYSPFQGVTLAFSVHPDLSRYDDYRGDLAINDSTCAAEVRLIDDFTLADRGTDQARQQPQAVLGGVPHPVISIQIPHGIFWKEVRLGAAPCFKTRLGYIVDQPDRWKSVLFSLLLDGKPAASRAVDVKESWAPGWAPWEVDLSAYAGRTVSLELKAESGPGWAVWGDPVLEWASEETVYAFFVAGHVYGHPYTDDTTIHPPFLEKVGWIRDYPRMKMGFFTGDIVRLGRAGDWDGVDRVVASLNMPVYFAPGNHDMTDRALFEARYGKTYFHFIYENDLFIVLDPNMDQWNISGDQLTFLKEVLEKNRGCSNVFVFLHQVIWVERKKIFRMFIPNSLAARAEHVNFWAEVEPRFAGLGKPVYFFAGDTGAFPSGREIMYYRQGNIRFIASGMGGGERDNFVVVKVKADKTVELELIALGTEDIHALGRVEDHRIVDP
jgi:hypothetical protein